MTGCIESKETIFRNIRIDESTNTCIVISTLEIIQLNLRIVVVAAVAVGVDVTDEGCSIIRRTVGVEGLAHAPRIVGVAGNGICVCVGYGYNVPLEILEEVIGNVVVSYTADCVLVIVEGYKSVTIPSLSQYFSTVERIIVSNTADSFARSDTVCIIGVINDSFIGLNKLSKLSALLPCEGVTEVVYRVALSIVGDSLTVIGDEQIFPCTFAV